MNNNIGQPPTVSKSKALHAWGAAAKAAKAQQGNVNDAEPRKLAPPTAKPVPKGWGVRIATSTPHAKPSMPAPQPKPAITKSAPAAKSTAPSSNALQDGLVGLAVRLGKDLLGRPDVPTLAEPPATPLPRASGNLSALAIAKLAESGITPEQAEALGMYSVENARLELGYPELQPEPGLVLPYFKPNGEQETFERDGKALPFFRVRYLRQRSSKLGFVVKKKEGKYAQPARSGVHAYFPRCVGWADVLPDTRTSLLWIEGELKAAKAALEGFDAFAAGGAWNFREHGGLEGIRQLIPELAQIPWQGRTVFIVLDGDTATNDSVANAEGAIALELGLRRGAEVRRVRFPAVQKGQQRWAADDYIVAHDADAFEKLLRAAETMCEADALVAELNQEYAVVAVHGRTVVARFSYDAMRRQRKIDYFREQDFKLLLADRTVANPREPNKRMPLAKAWLEHPHRLAYPNGVVFVPLGDAPEGTLNLWHGFSVEPVAGDWSLLRSHLRDNICAGNLECFEYVLNWLARMVQQPNKPGQVAIVLRGKKGTGKSKLGYWIGQMVRDHFIHATQPAHIVGQFNSHLLNCIFVMADEALFAGDPKVDNILKGLITEESRVSEQKYMPAISVPNLLHVMMATNSSLAVAATDHERRFCVLDVGDAHIQDHPYFAAIDRQMEKGGLEAMLHELLHRDISGFEVRRFPRTEALMEQQIQTLHGRGTVAGWVYDCLSAGEIRDERNPETCFTWSKGELEIPKNTARRIFDNWAKPHGRRPIDPGLFGREMRATLGHALREIRRRTNKGRPENYVLRSLAECRQAYRVAMAMPDLWSGEDE